MKKVKQSKLEKLLFEVYDKGVQNEDCDLTDFESKIKQALIIAVVSNWVAVKNGLPDNDGQVFVKYENGKYGINEWWENDNCWKYNFKNMIVKEWCKPPCC